MRNVDDDFSQEAVEFRVDFSISGKKQARIFSEQKRVIHYIDKDKPTQHAFFESFYGRIRDECSNEQWFSDINETKEIIYSR